jgi:hypothetical protein
MQLRKIAVSTPFGNNYINQVDEDKNEFGIVSGLCNTLLG